MSKENQDKYQNREISWDSIKLQMTNLNNKLKNRYNAISRTDIYNLNNLIRRALQINNSLPKEIYDLYLDLVFPLHLRSNAYYSSINLYHSVVNDMLCEMTLYHMPAINILNSMICQGLVIVNTIIDILLDQKKILDETILDSLFLKFNINKKTIIKILSSYQKYRQIKYLKTKPIYQIKEILEILNNNSNISIDEEIFNRLLTKLPINNPIMKKYVSKFKITDEGIANASINYNNLKSILDMKILPSNLKEIAFKQFYKINDLHKILDLLIVYGYVITHTDINFLIFYNNLDKKYIKYDLNKESLLSLMSGNYPDIDRYTFNCDPDEDCIRALLINNTMIDGQKKIAYLKKTLNNYKINISNNFINELLTMSNKNISKDIKLLFLNQNVNINDEIYEKELETSVDQLSKCIFESLYKKYKKYKQKYGELEDEKEINKEETKELLDKMKNKIKDKIDLDKLTEEEFEQLPKKLKKLEKLEIDTGSNYDEENMIDSEEDMTNKLLHIDMNKLKTPKNKRKKNIIPNKLSKIFGLDKSTEMSYMEIRKLFRNMIINQGLLNSKNKQLFSLQLRARKILGLPNTGNFRVSDMDKIISLCYN